MTTFKSRIDTWYKIIHWGCLGILVVVIGLLWLDPESTMLFKALFTVFMGGMVWLMMDIYANTAYTIAAGVLHIRAGRLQWQVQVSNVESVQPSRSILSSPALSLDRLAIKQLNRGMPTVISPEDKEAFLAALAEADSGLELRDGEVHRVQAG